MSIFLRKLAVCVSCIVFFYGCTAASPPESLVQRSMLIIDQPVHFLDVEGADIVISPGPYLVEVTTEDELRLRSLEDQFNALLQTKAIRHTEKISEPTALSVPNGEERHHIVFLLPDNTGLDAYGTYSATALREYRFLSSAHPHALRDVKNEAIHEALISVKADQLRLAGVPVLTNPPSNATLSTPRVIFEWKSGGSQPASTRYELCVTELGTPCTSGLVYRWVEDAQRVQLPGGGPFTPEPSTGTPITVTRYEVDLPGFYQAKPLEWLIRACAPRPITLGGPSSTEQCISSERRRLMWGFTPPTLLPVSGQHPPYRPTFDWTGVPAAESYLFCISAPGVACPPQTVDNSQTLVIETNRYTTMYTPSTEHELSRFSGTTPNWTAAACSTSSGCVYQRNVQSIWIPQPPQPQGFVKSPIELYRYDSLGTPRPSWVFCGNRVKESGQTCTSKATGPNGEMPAHQRIEVRGWVWGTPHFADYDEEVVFGLLVDHGWTSDTLESSGVTPYNTADKINRVITPHNIITFGEGDLGGPAQLAENVWGGKRSLVLKIEVNGWGPERMGSVWPPRDWFHRAGNAAWAFDPLNPPAVRAGQLQSGDYVRLVGTLWEDEPHVTDGGNGADQGKDAKDCWNSGSTGQGRWGRGFFEIHPVDYMAKIDRDPENDRAGTLYAIAMCDDGEIVVPLSPPDPRPSPTATVGVEEYVDSDFTVWRSVKTPNRVTITSATTAQVHVKVEGGGPLGLGHGAKFKALYRVFWR